MLKPHGYLPKSIYKFQVCILCKTHARDSSSQFCLHTKATQLININFKKLTTIGIGGGGSNPPVGWKFIPFKHFLQKKLIVFLECSCSSILLGNNSFRQQISDLKTSYACATIFCEREATGPHFSIMQKRRDSKFIKGKIGVNK